MLFNNKFPIPVSETVCRRIIKNNNNIPKRNDAIFFPNPHYRSLFRCLCVLNIGIVEFKKLMKDPQLIIKESELAVQYIEQSRIWFKENAHKQYVKLSVVETELITKMQPLSLSTFFTLCAVFNKPVLLEYDAFVIQSFPSTEYYKLNYKQYSDSIHFGIESELKPYNINNNKILITNFSKPLYSLSHYKIRELIELSVKINLSIEGKNKTDLYAQIQHYYKDHGLNYK
jgi:hypothetical protein